MLYAALLILNSILAMALPQRFADVESGHEITALSAPPSIVQGLPLDPQHRAALQSDIDRRDYDAAEELLVAEIEKNPKSPQLLTILASVSFLNGNYLNTAIAMKKAERIAPLDNRERFTLAMAYVALKRPDWARPELEKLAQSGEKNAIYPYWLSRLDYNDMNFESAVANGRRAIEWDPSFMRAYDNLGLIYEAIGKFDEAIESYNTALKLNDQKKPCSPWPGMNQGALFIKLGHLDKAEAPLQESIGCDARFPQAHYQMGLLLEKRNRLPDALRELEQAAMLNPTYPEPYYAQGRIYRKLGDEAKAERAWATFHELKEEKAKTTKLRKQSR
ncbi:MAG TPA: tetratricopeptide repeat protein [Terriglobia bacterium]|jgi:Flp pilus assembly protein TadD|nr:tetratricopeptide repeat protein [Terriglobia bacterium]